MKERERVELLDHGYIALVETWGSDERIIESARMSTGKGFLGWGPNYKCRECGCLWRNNHDQTLSLFDGAQRSCTACEGDTLAVSAEVAGDEKLLRYLYENKHMTPFEMAGATFEVQAPIFVFREWHRHRVPFSYNELSARYTPMPDVNYIPSMSRLMLGSDGKNKQAGTVAGAAVLTEEAARAFQEALAEMYRAQEELYQQALKSGVPKELARAHLPVGRYSRMAASANVRGWLNFAALRSDKNPGAQWEIRQYANELVRMLGRAFPRTVALFAGA